MKLVTVKAQAARQLWQAGGKVPGAAPLLLRR